MAFFYIIGPCNDEYESAKEWDRIHQVFLIKIMISDYTIDYKTNSPLQPL